MAAAGHHSSKILQHVDCLNFLNSLCRETFIQSPLIFIKNKF